MFGSKSHLEVPREVVYLSEADWPEEIDHTLVAYCSDPYYREATVEFFEQHLGLSHYDQLVNPSGPAVFLQASLTFTSDRPRLDLLYKRHNLRHFVAVAHLNCTYYKLKYPSLDAAARRRKQEEDLIEFKGLIRRIAPEMEVSLYFAEEFDGKIQFTCLRC